MKDKILEISHHNWSMMGPGDWKKTKWTIYDDLTMDIEEEFVALESKKINTKINQIQLNEIISNLNNAKRNDRKIEAFDGSAWEYIQYENGEIVWSRKLDYIYGIQPLENISLILGK